MSRQGLAGLGGEHGGPLSWRDGGGCPSTPVSRYRSRGVGLVVLRTSAPAWRRGFLCPHTSHARPAQRATGGSAGSKRGVGALGRRPDSCTRRPPLCGRPAPPTPLRPRSASMVRYTLVTAGEGAGEGSKPMSGIERLQRRGGRCSPADLPRRGGWSPQGAVLVIDAGGAVIETKLLRSST